MSTDTETPTPDAGGAELVRVPQGAARLQQRPIIDTIDDQTLALIARQVAPGCTRGEIGHFLELCAHYDLDPFAKEAWCAKGKGENAKLLVMVGRDGLRKIAHRQGLTMNQDVVRAKDTYIVEFIDNEADAKPGEWEANGSAAFHRVTHKHTGMGEMRGAIIGAWCQVRTRARREAGWFEAQLSEYRPKDQRKLQYSPWGSQESVMILAAAERQALRQATPLSGLLAEGEEARVEGFDAPVVESVVQELTDQEVEELSGAIAAAWTDDQARMELVAAGAQDVSDLEVAVRSLTRAQALELISHLGAGVEIHEEPQDAVLADDEGPVAEGEPVEEGS